MTKPKLLGRSASGQQRRQAVLDHLHTHGPCTTRQLSDALNLPFVGMIDRIRIMRNLGEVSSEEKMFGHYSAQVHTALVTVTVATITKKAAGTKPLAEVIDIPPPRTRGIRNERFYDAHAEPLKGQGGQGSYGVMPRMKNVMLGE